MSNAKRTDITEQQQRIEIKLKARFGMLNKLLYSNDLISLIQNQNKWVQCYG